MRRFLRLDSKGRNIWPDREAKPASRRMSKGLGNGSAHDPSSHPNVTGMAPGTPRRRSIADKGAFNERRRTILGTTVSRTVSSARNVGVSILAQVMVVALGFVTRTVFVTKLGVSLLGINSLLTSVLALLAFADLGINGAVMYALYKPLKESNTDSVAAIVRYANRMLRWVALAVAGLGLAATPFIHRLVNLEEAIDGLEIYYLVLLANTVAGYLMLARLVLLDADQKIYVTKAYSLVFNVLRSIAQIVSLLVFESFLAFLMIQVFFTISNNLTVYLRAGRLYPYIKNSSTSLVRSERRSILTSVRAMMIFRVGGLILNNSAAVLISTIVGTVALGYYSNYMLIVSSAAMITEVVFASLTPSVGNLVAAGDQAAGRRVFDEIVLLSVILHGVIAVGMVVLVDDFVVLWLGSDFVLPPAVLIGVVLNFYVSGTLMPMWSFRSATGLFRQTQFVMLLTAVLSVALSFALGNVFGLAGVVIAPGLARLLTGGWCEPWLLLRDHLAGGVFPYFRLQAGAFVVWALIALVIASLGARFSSGPLGSIVAKAALCAVLLPGGSWLAFRRTGAFHALLRRAQTLIRGTRHKASGRSA